MGIINKTSISKQFPYFDSEIPFKTILFSLISETLMMMANLTWSSKVAIIAINTLQ